MGKKDVRPINMKRKNVKKKRNKKIKMKRKK